MTAHPPLWVVDASVAIKLFITEKYSGETESFFEKVNLNSPDSLYVPDLFYTECANIFWKYVRRHGLPVFEAKKEMTALKQLKLRTVSGAELMERALELALRWNITAYDASYLALAERLKASLVTADEKLIKRIKSPNLRMEWIGEIS